MSEEIVGYRKLGDADVATINYLKSEERRIVCYLRDHLERTDIDMRALSIAITEIQTGFMWAVRAIARPDGE